MKATVSGRKRQDEKKVRELVTRATEALMNQRRLAMRYESASSQRARDYVIEPLRISYAAAESTSPPASRRTARSVTSRSSRIRTLGVLDQRFEPRPLPVEPFAHSLGAYSGTPERIEIEFDAAVADYVAGREWHTSQAFERREDGSLLMRLDVCVDPPLRRWILDSLPQPGWWRRCAWHRKSWSHWKMHANGTCRGWNCRWPESRQRRSEGRIHNTSCR